MKNTDFSASEMLCLFSNSNLILIMVPLFYHVVTVYSKYIKTEAFLV